MLQSIFHGFDDNHAFYKLLVLCYAKDTLRTPKRKEALSMVLNLILAGLVAVLVVTGIVSKATDK